MKRLEIWGRELECQGSPYCYYVYKTEFDGDLGAHLVKSFKTDPYDTEDFLRIIWTMCKTYDESVADYEDWLMDFPAEAFDILEASDNLAMMISAIDAELFRGRQTRWQRFKRWVKQALERLLGLLPGHNRA